MLGVRIGMHHPGTARLRKFALEDAQTLLQSLQYVALTFRDRRLSIRMLVISKICWAAGLAAAPMDQLNAPRKDVKRTFGGRVLPTNSTNLMQFC